MESNIKIPVKTTNVVEKRSAESIQKEKEQNKKMISLGINPYELDAEEGYTEKEQEIINRALMLIVTDKEVPEELAEEVRAITRRNI